MLPVFQDGGWEPVKESQFNTTHWSVVMASGQANSPQAANALQRLCSTYWYPLYAFVRRQGRSAHDAQDLTQAFFARLLEKNSLAAADRLKGKFRSFLIMALKRFLADEYDKATAQKRGGRQAPISLDEQTAEERYRFEPVDNCTPEKLFERRWAMTVLEEARAHLREEYEAAGKREMFDRLAGFYRADESTIGYAELAALLGVSENAIRSQVHRLRRRYRQLVREEIAHTVSDPTQIDEEIRHLLAALGQ
jgi:RNA polymerase sigma factor (sigma-70 family)